ncbi:MAG: hypothetical protein M0R06_08260 [Sphaerochaeta sp.]|jgi:uncharacterized membrane protein|nr:hypothetical protein [Sphaerochaeta sp.]
MTTNAKIATAIYFITLGILLYYNLTHPPVNDSVKEYEVYLLNIQDGWEYRRLLVNSCLTTTWIPAMLQRYTGIDQMILFRVFPCIFYALMPAFTYLIAQRYLDVKYAIIACLTVIFNSHILFFPDIGRVGVGIAFLAGMIWALLERKMVWAVMFALLVVFSHYGTSLIALGLTVACIIGYMLCRKKLLPQYIVVFGVLLVSIGIWHFWISSYSGWTMLTYGIQTDMSVMTGDIADPELGWSVDEFLDIHSREYAVLRALGLVSMTVPETIEVVANWLVVGAITLGLWLLVRSKQIDTIFKVMGVSLWLLIIGTVAVPWLSRFYGGMRVYFTTLPVLAAGLPVGIRWIAEKTKLARVKVMPLVLCMVVLALLAVSTSGLIYRAFGEVKSFPVRWQLESEMQSQEDDDNNGDIRYYLLMTGESRHYA